MYNESNTWRGEGFVIGTLLLVDDEPTTRRGLLSSIPWVSLGVTEVIEARDGVEAMRLSMQSPPDIVLTDVRMPRMNGIELAMELRKLKPSVKLIFISGYSDKEYLRAAIRLGVISYVEKPIDINEITKAIAKAAEQANAAAAQPHEDFLPLVRQDMIYRLLKPGADVLDLERGMSLLNMRLSIDAWYAVMMVKLDGGADFMRDWIARLERSWQEAVLCEKEGLIVILVKSIEQTMLSGTCDAMLRQVRRYADAHRAFVAVGLAARGMSCIHVSYEQAVVALQSFFFLGYGQVMRYRQDADTAIQDSLEEPFMHLLSCGRYDELESCSLELCAKLAEQPHILVDHAKQLFTRLLLALRADAERQNLPNKEQQSVSDDLLQSAIAGRETLAQYQELLLQAIKSFLNVWEDSQTTQTANRKVTATLRMIESQYADPNLCVNALADQVCLTQPYLSMLFKKTFGRSISEHLLELRIEKSKSILIKEDILLREVASRVGYSDTNTYAKAFKRVTGLSPARFRQKYQR